MPLKEHLINCLLEDKSIIDELLLIDNRVQYTSLTYENILNNLKNAVVYDNLDVVSSYIAITDGEIDSVLKAKELYELYKKYDEAYFNEKVLSVLTSNMTISDVLNLYYSFDFYKKQEISCYQ